MAKCKTCKGKGRIPSIYRLVGKPCLTCQETGKRLKRAALQEKITELQNRNHSLDSQVDHLKDQYKQLEFSSKRRISNLEYELNVAHSGMSLLNGELDALREANSPEEEYIKPSFMPDPPTPEEPWGSLQWFQAALLWCMSNGPDAAGYSSGSNTLTKFHCLPGGDYVSLASLWCSCALEVKFTEVSQADVEDLDAAWDLVSECFELETVERVYAVMVNSSPTVEKGGSNKTALSRFRNLEFA